MMRVNLSHTLLFLTCLGSPNNVQALNTTGGFLDVENALDHAGGLFDVENPTEGIPAQSCPDVLDKSTEIDDRATLRYAIVPSNPPGSGNGLLCGCLEAENDGWISLAFSTTGGMIGSEAIIGLPEDDTVLKYDMTGKGQGGVTVMSDNKQTLKDTSLVQEDGKTVIKFTKLLVEDGEISILEDGSNIFLHARGDSSLGFHSNGYLSFRKDFSEDQDVENEVIEENEVVEDAVVPPETEPVLAAKDCTKEFCDFELDPDYKLRYLLNVPDDSSVEECTGCTVSMELIHEGEAWVSIAFSKDGQMIGSEAVIGIPGEGNVLKYHLESKSGVEQMPESQQTLLNTSIEAKDGQTIMKFTKIMKEPGEIEILAGDNNNLLGAYGSDDTVAYHVKRQSVVLNLNSGSSEEISTPNKAAWLAHGILGFMAWGVFVPFAVQSSILRNFLPKGPIWFKLHRGFNSLAYVLFVLIFVIAVVFTNKEGGNHFDNGHQKMGLAMLILASAQVFGGVFRPHTPAPDEETTPVRKGWEVGHRVLGVALLACGFWQMGKGIELYANKYSVSESDEDKLSIAYWVWIVVMSAAIVLGRGYFSYIKSSANNSGKEGDESAEKKDDTPFQEVPEDGNNKAGDV